MSSAGPRYLGGAEADRLLANLTEANKEFIDERLIGIKGRRRYMHNMVAASFCTIGWTLPKL